MLASVNGWVSWSALVALLAALPAVSSALEEKAHAQQAGEERWVPSLAVIGGVTIQSQEASVEASYAAIAPPDADEFAAAGDDLAVSPYVGANLELMSPALPLPGRPRVFVGAEILPTFAASRDVAKEGNPTGLVPPDLPPGFNYFENAIRGAGERTTAEIDTLVFGAAVGVAFPFELRGRPLRLKPSFGWIQYKIDVEGHVLEPQCPPSETATCNETSTREIDLAAQGSQSFNGIGAGLDIEMDAWRVGQFGVSLFLGGRFYRTVGDRTVDISDSATFPSDETPGMGPGAATANWSFEVDPWMYRAGLGLRFHWLGSRK